MARLSIRLFGPFEVTADEEPVTAFESDKVRALLAYLAAESGVSHRREKLAGLLWPAWPEKAARANLSRALTNLRHATGAPGTASPLLYTCRQAIELVPGEGVWIDVGEFERSVEQAGIVEPEDERSALHLASAVELYRGPFLDGFSLHGCPEFEDWALVKGEHLERQALLALDRLGRWYEGCGQLELALHYSWREVELAPWQERACRRLMRLLARTGQRAAAIAHYETCRRYLADELGVEPCDETVALYEQLRRTDALPTLSPVPLHNLCASLTPFVGREAELDEIGERLRDPACRLLTLVGPGGIGKTRLAIESAMGHLDRFPDGVFQVRLAGLRCAEAIVPAIAGAIGFAFFRRGDARRQLVEYLSTKTMLLVLDNFEHLLAGVGLVVELLQRAPGLRAVITSRTRLNLQGEYLFPVNGMALPPVKPFVTVPGGTPGGRAVGDGNVPDMEVSEYDAVKLFVSGARRVCPSFQLTGQQAAVTRICTMVDGMPLAILLASSLVDTASPAEIASRIGQNLEVLEATWCEVPVRHRSMRAVFDHSWEMLSRREQKNVGVLSVFCGSFDEGAAMAVARASPSDLQMLVDKSFLHRVQADRYQMHELLRQYAEDRLRRQAAAAGTPTAWEAALERHCHHYAAALERWGEELKGAGQQQALAEMNMDLENAAAAWRWAAGGRQVGRITRALEGLCLFYEWHVRYQEGETACRLAGERLASDASGPDTSVLARITGWQGAFNRLLERSDGAAVLFQRCEWLLGDPATAAQDLRWERAFLLFQKAHLALHSDREEANRLHERSAALFQAAGDAWWAAAALREQGRVAFYQGLHARARQLITASLEIRRALGDQRGIADALDGLGIIATFQGEMEEAERLLRDSSALFLALGNRADHASSLGNLGASLAGAGRLAEGHAALEEAIAVHSDLGQSWILAHWRALMAIVELWCGRYDQALAQSHMVSSLSQQIGYPRGLGLAHLVRGGVALVQSAYGESYRWTIESAALMRSIGQRDDLGWALGFLGRAAIGLGQLAEARRTLGEAVRLASQTRSFSILVFALPMIPLLLAEQGDNIRAVELHALVGSRIPLARNSPWYQKIVGRQIAATAACLPPGLATAAQVTGRSFDLWTVVAALAEELCAQEPGEERGKAIWEV